jgi:hypothetical protein
MFSRQTSIPDFYFSARNPRLLNLRGQSFVLPPRIRSFEDVNVSFGSICEAGHTCLVFQVLIFMWLILSEGHNFAIAGN